MVGDHWTLGNGDPKYMCKKVSRTKMRNKNSRIKIGGDHWTLGNGDPKYKCKKVIGKKKGGTKIGRSKIWWGTLGHRDPSASAKRSAEQKIGTKNGRTKIGN